MKIVVTGATSMLGVALIQKCIRSDGEVLAIARPNTSRLQRLPQSEKIKVIFSEQTDYDSICYEGEYDVFYNFAWGHTAKEERDNPFLQEENVKATLGAVTLAKRLGCKKFVQAGSQAEYGPTDGLISEENAPHPVSAYGMAKLSAGLLSRKACEQLEMQHIWTRIFSVYGINDNSGTMIDYAIHQFEQNKEAFFSSGRQMWNYLFESDAGEMLYFLGQKAETGIYHIAGNETKPLREFVSIIAEQMGKQTLCCFDDEEKPNQYGIAPSVAKTYQITEFTPNVSFEEGIQRIIERVEKN